MGDVFLTDHIVVYVSDDFYSGSLTREDSIELAVAVLRKLAPEKLK
jgi:hypothetical protein